MIEITPLDRWAESRIGCSPGTEEFRRRQFKLIRDTVQYIKENSPYYRKLLHNYDPQRLQNPGELARWPLTGQEQLRENGSRMVCVSQDDIARVISLTTSGTSGGSKRVWFTEDDQVRIRDFFRVGMSSFTAAGDIVYIAMPGPQDGSIGRLLSEALSEFGALGIAAGPVASTEAACAEIIASGATHFVGLPKQAAGIVSGLVRGKSESRLKTFLLTGDYVPGSLKLRINRMLGADCYEHWGMTETGLGGGVSCGSLPGYHLREADLYFEIIDPYSCDVLPDGEPGEIVVTTLRRRGMPLFRYRTGDRGRMLSGRCHCGSGLRLMERCCGRLDDSLILPSGRRLQRCDWEELLYSFDDIIDYSVSLNPLSAEIIGMGIHDSGCRDALGRLFSGRISFLAVADWSYSGAQKSYWSLI